MTKNPEVLGVELTNQLHVWQFEKESQQQRWLLCGSGRILGIVGNA